MPHTTSKKVIKKNKIFQTNEINQKAKRTVKNNHRKNALRTSRTLANCVRILKARLEIFITSFLYYILVKIRESSSLSYEMASAICSKVGHGIPPSGDAKHSRRNVVTKRKTLNIHMHDRLSDKKIIAL